MTDFQQRDWDQINAHLFRADPLAFFEQLDTMAPGEQSRSLRMIRAFVDLQKVAGGKIDFQGCVRIAFNVMVKG